MALLTTTRPMHVDSVEVINGLAGDPCLYKVDLTDRQSWKRLVVSGWGRGLRVPYVGHQAEISAGGGTWGLVDAAHRANTFPELTGLERIKGIKKDTGPVAALSYRDQISAEYPSIDQKTTVIPPTLTRWVDQLTRWSDRIADFMDNQLNRLFGR